MELGGQESHERSRHLVEQVLEVKERSARTSLMRGQIGRAHV